MSLGDRIRAAIDASGEKDFVIAGAARISTTTLSNIVRGVTQDPSISVVAAIADALGESVDALLGRTGHPLLKQERQTLTNAAHILLDRVVPQPNEQKVRSDRMAPRSRKRTESAVVSDVAATPNRQIFTDVREIRRFPIPRDLRNRGVRRVFRVDGDSMIGDGIQHGDILFVRTNVTLEQANNQIVVCRHGDDEMVKRLRVNADRHRDAAKRQRQVQAADAHRRTSARPAGLRHRPQPHNVRAFARLTRRRARSAAIGASRRRGHDVVVRPGSHRPHHLPFRRQCTARRGIRRRYSGVASASVTRSWPHQG